MNSNDAQQQQQQQQMAQQGQMPMNMAAFGYPTAASQEALMNMLRGGMNPGFPQQGQQFAQDPSGQMQGDGSGNGGQQNQQQQAMQQAMMNGQQMYPGMMFDPSQMQQMQMAGFGGFPMGQGFAMDPSGQMNMNMNGMFFPGMQMQAPVDAQMSQANAALGQAQANTMNSSAALAQASGIPNNMMQPGMGGQPNAMNPQQGMMMGDPNMLLRMFQQQAAGGNFFGAPGAAGQQGQQGQMFGFGAGLSGAAGITAASYLNMAQQAGIGTGAGDLQQSMMPMMGAAVGGAAVLNPFARPDKKLKQRKPKGKPKRPLSAYNIFFKDERARILSGIPDEGKKKKKKKVKKEDGDDEDDPTPEDGDADEKASNTKEDKDDDEEKKKEPEEGEKGDDGNKKKEKEVKVKKEEGADDADDDADGEGGDDDADKEGDEKDGKGGGKKRKRVPHGKIGFESLAKIIGRRWKELPPEQLEEYKKRAEDDMKRYRKEMETYLQKQREGLEQSREHLENMVDDETKKRYFGDGEQAEE